MCVVIICSVELSRPLYKYPVKSTSFLTIYMSLCVSRGIPKAWSWAHFGQGSGPIQLDAVQCTGNELSLDECRHSGWEQHNCDHMEDAGVSCNPYTGLVLYIDTHIQTLTALLIGIPDSYWSTAIFFTIDPSKLRFPYFYSSCITPWFLSSHIKK